MIMLCRLCLLDSSEVLDIFEGEGERLKIADIIGQHFWFVPIKDDQISNICCICWLKVDEFHHFYCFIKDAQKKLSEILLTDQKSHHKTTGTYLKKEDNDDGDDEWIYDTVVNKYVNILQDKIVNDDNDIEIKSELCDNDRARHDKFKKLKDPIDTDNTNQSDLDSEIRLKSCNNHNSNTYYGIKTTSKIRSKTIGKKKISSSKKKSINVSDNEEDLPLKHFVQLKSIRDIERSERLKKSKEKDDVIANFMKLKCEICHEEFTTFAQVSQHYRTNHNTKGYVVCCNKKLYKKTLLFDHINIHRNPEHFKCDECNKTFSDKECLKNHMLRHSKSNFECDQCHKKFPKEHLLIRHKSIHVPLEERQFKCEDCDKTFPTKYSLEIHCRYVHKNTYGKMCHICAKVIRSGKPFEKHQLEHAGIVEPKVQCEKCGSWFKNKVSLRVHKKRLHTESSTIYKCEICDKVAPTKAALKSHLKFVHEMKRNYQCGICDKAFKRSLSLKEHMTTHTGEILYTCPHCPKTFNSNANMHAHRKKMHKNEWEESRKDRGVLANEVTSHDHI